MYLEALKKNRSVPSRTLKKIQNQKIEISFLMKQVEKIFEKNPN